jgi:DHA2 family lincomycin resistance protein-like MFS transporter
MSRQAATMLADGLPQLTATAGGIRAAFVWGAIISTLGIVGALFVRSPPNQNILEI